MKSWPFLFHPQIVKFLYNPDPKAKQDLMNFILTFWQWIVVFLVFLFTTYLPPTGFKVHEKLHSAVYFSSVIADIIPLYPELGLVFPFLFLEIIFTIPFLGFSFICFLFMSMQGMYNSSNSMTAYTILTCSWGICVLAATKYVSAQRFSCWIM